MAYFAAMRCWFVVFLAASNISNFRTARAKPLDQDGLCSLYAFLPFTTIGTFGCDDCLNLGFSHYVSVLMAMDHFNARDSPIVPDLAELVGPDCPVQFDIENTVFFDADPVSHAAAEQVVALLPERPCAAVGPFDDNIAIALSTLAATVPFPLMVHRAFSLRVSAEYASPMTTQIYPDLITTTEHTVELLLRKGRTNYTAFLYALTETGTHWRESMSIVMDHANMRHKTFSFNSILSPASGDDSARGMRNVMTRVKQSGYRTIVVAAEVPLLELSIMAEAAVELDMTNGDYLWVFIGNTDANLWFSQDWTLQQLMKGSLHVLPYEAIWEEGYPFLEAWKSQDVDAVQRLRERNPVSFVNSTNDPLRPTQEGFAMTDGGFVYPYDDFFQKSMPQFGSGFVYDSVIATGLGACRSLANRSRNGTALLESDAAATTKAHVEDFVQSIRSTEFWGASFYNSFCDDCGIQGIRDPGSSVWMVVVPYSDPSDSFDANNGLVLAEIMYVENGTVVVEKLAETYYADGRNVPPDLLRDPTEQNYLSKGLQAFGFALMGITGLFSLLSVVWVYLHRGHRILRASQPEFLLVLSFGSLISTSAVFTISFDEEKGWSPQQLSRACMTTPWLFATGFILIYGALFGKLWRINQVLQTTRRKIDVKQVAWPCLVLVILAFIILGLWSGLDPMEWERREIDIETGESIGSCKSSNMAAFTIPLVVVMIIPMLLTGLMAWRTRDVDEAYSESHYIFIMIAVQAEIMLFAVPMIEFLKDVSTDARYIGFTLILWTFPTSALFLIIGPKILAYWKAVRGGASRTRGSRGSVHVSGVNLNNQQAPPPARATYDSSLSTHITHPNVSAISHVTRESVSSNPEFQESGESKPKETSSA